MAGKKTFTAGAVLTAADVNDYLMDQSIMVFANAAARTTAIPSPTQGMVTYLSDINSFQMYNGSAYVAIGGSGLTIKSVAPTTATITNAVYSGTTITYTAANSFTAGDVVRINGIVYTAGAFFQNSFNFTRATIATASATQFTVTVGASANINAYVSGGTATKIQSNLQEWQDSSGTALSSVNQFGNNSGAGLVLIDTITVASRTNNYLAFNGVFSSVYDSYRIVVTNMTSNSFGAAIRMQLTAGGVPTAGTAYKHASTQQAYATGTVGVTVFGNNVDSWQISSSDPNGKDIIIDVHRPAVAARDKTFSVMGADANGSLVGNGISTSTTAHDGFALYMTSGASVFAGTFRIYGYRT